MALDVVNLGFQVDSSALVKAKTDLADMANAAAKADGASEKLSTSQSRLASIVSGLDAHFANLASILQSIDAKMASVATATTQMAGAQQEVGRAVAAAAAAITTMGTATAAAGTGLTELARQSVQVDAGLDQAAQASRTTAASLDVLGTEATQAVTGLQGTARALAQTAQAHSSVNKAMAAAGQATGNTGGIFQRYGHQIQNTSYQLQDMVVQISMGTDAMRAMSMQLPQMLGGFGAWGALIGVAVGVLGGLVPMLFDMESAADKTADSTERLDKAMRGYTSAVESANAPFSELVEKYGRGAVAARDLFEQLARLSRLDAAKALRENMTAVNDQMSGMLDLIKAIDAEMALGLGDSGIVAASVKRLRDEFGLTVEQARELSQLITDARNAKSIEDQTRAMTALAGWLDTAERNGLVLTDRMVDFATAAAQGAVRAHEVAVATEQANNNTGAAITTTNNWAVAMSGVAAQINAISAALASIGGGMLTRVSAFVERNALAAGKTVAQARVEVEKFKATTEWDARIMGARGKGGILGAVQERALEAAKAIDLANIEMTAENAILVKNAQAAEKAAKAKGKKKKADKEDKNLLAEMNRELLERRALLGVYGDERQQIEAVQKVLSKLGDEAKKYSQSAILDTAARIVALENEEKAWDETVQRMESLTDGLAGAWGDWLSGGLRDFKGFVSNILGSFKSMVSDMIAAAVRAPIGRALGAAMGMGGVVPAFAGDPLATALGGIPGLAGGGILGGIGKSIGTALTGAIGGFTSVFKGLLSGGLSGGIGAIGSALGGATSGLAGLATAAGAIAAPLAAVAAVFSFFKSKTTELDRGLRVTVDGMDALVETFRKTETRRFWGLSKKRRTSYEEADAEIADPIESAIGKVQQSVLDMAASIGTGSEAFTQFAYQFKLSTKGMTDEEALAAIQEEMGKFGDAFAAMIPDIADFAKEGEGIGATLERLSAALGTVNGVLGDLGLELYRVSVRGADAASQFADLFGGLDQFAQASSAYYEAFYSDAERFARLQEVSTKAIRDAGLAVPATREAYRRMVEAQDLSSEAGRKAAAVLLQLAPAFDQIYDAAEATRAAAAQAIADANASRTSLLDSLLTDQQRAAQAQAEITATFAALNLTVPTTLDGLRAIIAGLDLTGEAGRDALARIAGIADALRDRLTPVAQAAERVTSGGGSSGSDNTRSEREQLERQLLQLQGNTAELLRRERLDVAPANRALWDMVQAAKAAADVMDKFSSDNFASRVEFELARNRQANINATPATAATADRKIEDARRARDSDNLARQVDLAKTMIFEMRAVAREISELRMVQEEGAA